MNGWQEPKDGKRIYIITDNTKMNGFIDYIKSEDVDRLYVTYSESRVNLGIHYYRNKLYTSNLVGICRIKSVDNETLYDAEGNELLIKVIPRFNVKIVELLNYMRDDDEFDRYMAPQTISNRHKERDIEAIDRNEIFYFFGNENPLKVDDKISGENSIITVTVFLTLLRLLCKKPLMGRMLKEEKNLTGKVKGKIVIEKNIRANTMHGRNDRFYCQYLQFSEDIIENQILKAALKKSKRFVIEYFKGWGKDNNNYTSMISYCSNALRNISDIQCDGEACNGLKFSGCYIYYKPVMAMAKMVLDDISIESNGDVSTTGYILPYAISMEKLFEVYVRAYFKKNGIASYRSKSNTGIRLEKYDNKTDVFLEEEGLENPGKYISGSIKPDLILTDQESGETMVLDVKYKDYRNGNSRDDRLQLLAYSMMMNANNIGIILPAQDEVEIFDARRINSMENRVVKYHQMLLGIMKDNPVIANYIKTNAFKKEGIDMADVLTPEQRRKNMQHIRSNDTKIEVLLRRALWEKGYRYRKNYKKLPGKPDIALTKYKIAIFCDGEFFHGKDWEVLKPRLEQSNNSEFWIKKISRNRERDDEVNKKLLFMGWTVIRFWGDDIKKNTEECVRVVEETIFELMYENNDREFDNERIEEV